MSELEQEVLNDHSASVLSSDTDADWYLQYLVELVNGTNNEFPVTLHANGLMISGFLASGHRYFEDLAVKLRDYLGNDETAAENAATLTDGPIDLYQVELEGKNQNRPQFLHLRSAQVFIPGQKPIPQDGVWWRGRFTSISGFHFGILGITQS